MVILPIENIKQERDEWCWLAIVEQVILWRNGQSPDQPKLARLIGKRGGGTLGDIATLIKKQTDLQIQKLRGNSLETIETFIEDRAPVVLEVSVSDFERHVLLLKGLVEDKKTGQKLFLINDPLRMSGFGLAVRPEILLEKLKASMVLMEP